MVGDNMISGGLVALASVLVTGIAAPLITFLATRYQLLYSNSATVRRDALEVLDLAAEELARAMRANGHCLGLWRRGVPDTSPEAREFMSLRSVQTERVTVMHSRLCIRFGVESPAASTYERADYCISELTKLFDAYRRNQPYSDVEKEAKSLSQELGGIRTSYLAAACAISGS
jgi:hypothetical protein